MNFRWPLTRPLPKWSDIWGYFVGDKYKANKEGEEIVGIVDPLAIWATTVGVDNSTDDAGNSGLSKSIFDTTSRADAARIRLINSSGTAKTIIGCVIRGKPVLRYSGEHGRVHDSLIDYDDIIRNGEKKFEFGNNYVCLRSQLEALADWHWKNLTTKRHIYTVEIPGRCYWYSPGEWYTLTISDVKGAEVLDGVVVECCHVQVENQTNQLGRSVIVFREVYKSWVHDINAVAYFLSGGDPVKALNFDRVKIASSTYLRAADYYCDGTADEVQINAAVVYLNGLGGGIIELTEGTFVTAAAIAPDDNIGIVGSGWNTIIEKNGNYNGINLAGSGGSEYSNLYLNNFKIMRNANDTNSKQLINFDYVDNLTINHIYIYDSYVHGIYLTNCDNPTINDNRCEGCGGYGLYISSAVDIISSAKITNNYLYNNSSGLFLNNIEYASILGNVADNNTGNYGFYFAEVNYSSICNNIAVNNGGGNTNDGGFIQDASGSHNIYSGNVAEGNNKYGFRIVDAGCTRNVFTGNRATGNTTANFTDTGTNTTDSGNDWN